MNDIEGALTLDIFGWAEKGRMWTGYLFHRLMQEGVVFEHCSYSDTRYECDILFTFEDNEYVLIGGCGSTLEFHSVDKGLNHWWSMRPDPPNVATIVYRMLARLRGEKIDYQRTLPGEALVWYHSGGMRWSQSPDFALRMLLNGGRDAEGNSR